MSMKKGRQIADRLSPVGIIDENTLLYYMLFAHHCSMVYDELKITAEKYGFETAYGGLKVGF